MDSKYFITNSLTNSIKRKHGFSDMATQILISPKKAKGQTKKTAWNLPVFNCRQRILMELEANDILLIMGETGSGKTTQIPQFIYRSGKVDNMIAITQPRRIAAITIAKRVAQELSSSLGDVVGYKVRFEDTTTDRTRIKFLTDGVLLREAIADRLLLKYSVIMLDEAHDRTINTDVLFGIAKEAQQERNRRKLPKLKLIITSATMDIDHLGKYFNVPGMYLEGRAHHVRVMHTKEPQPDYTYAILVTLVHVHRNTPTDHDVLIFLTGQEEIEALAHQIRQLFKVNNNGKSDVRVFTLYSHQPQGIQLECFMPSPPNTRKIVLATNIAETSITIAGIRCVIDCGFVKQKYYNQSSNLDILRTIRISHAQAWQRCGRAGRDAPGTCYRIYTKNEMNSFQDTAEPEILRANLNSTIMQLLALGIDCQKFDFLDAPSSDSIKKAYQCLKSLGAVKLLPPSITSLGRQMVLFPLDPRLAKLVLSAPKFNCLEEILSLVAILSTENIFIGCASTNESAALAYSKFKSKFGDHLTLLKIFVDFQKTKKPKLWCHDNFFNFQNIMYACKVRNQLVSICLRIGLTFSSCKENLDAVRQCLITGFFDNIAVLQRDGSYLTIFGQLKAKIHPSSVFHSMYKPDYILFNEIVFTERYFLRNVTEICPEWIDQIVPSLKCIKNYDVNK